MTRRPQFRTPGRYPDTILRSLAIDSAPAGRPHTMRSSALIPHRRVKTQGSLPTEDAVLILLFSLVASGQIKLRKIDGTTMAAVTASRCGQRPDITELCYRAPPTRRSTEIPEDRLPIFHIKRDTTPRPRPQTSPRNYPGSCSQREPKRPKADGARSANLRGVVWGALGPVSI